MTQHEFEAIQKIAESRVKRMIERGEPLYAVTVDHERASVRTEVAAAGIRGAQVANAAFDFYFAMHTAEEA